MRTGGMNCCRGTVLGANDKTFLSIADTHLHGFESIAKPVRSP
jgi:hypothetical protein